MFDKITARIVKLAYGLNPDFCDAVGPADCRAPATSRHDAAPERANVVSPACAGPGGPEGGWWCLQGCIYDGAG